MKRLIALLALLTLIILGVWLARESPGFVVIGRGPWSVETSLPVFLALLLAAFFLFYFLLRLALGMWRLPERLAGFFRQRRQQRAWELLPAGVCALLEGQWQRAGAAFGSSSGLLHHLGAAYAAQQLGDLKRRDEALAQAHALAPETPAVGLFQARLSRAAGEPRLALATLEAQRARFPRHPAVLQQLAELYRETGQWSRLIEVIPELRKRKALDNAALEAMENQAFAGVLQESAQHGAEALDQLWNSLPKAPRLGPRLVETYVRALIAQGRAGLGEPLLRESLRSHWDERLVALYGSVEADSAKQLNQAETWLKSHPADPVLLLTLGRLCLRSRLWGKAQQYLDQSLSKAPRPETYLALGELLGQIGDPRQAAEAYRKGLERFTENP